jgi:hypothetical protein
MRRKVSWHERWSGLSWLRRRGRSALYRLVERLFATDDGRSVLAAATAGLAPRRVRLPPPVTAPYPELGTSAFHIEPEPGTQPPIFITARFRSGSTFVWTTFGGSTATPHTTSRTTSDAGSTRGHAASGLTPRTSTSRSTGTSTRDSKSSAPGTARIGSVGTFIWTNPTGRPRYSGTSSS